MLSRQEGYALRTIKEKNYLMPYGQKIADQRRGMVLNETGSFLWNFLEQPKGKNEILEAVVQHYEVQQEEREEIEAQVEGFLAQLVELGVLSESLQFQGEPLWGILQIGNLRISLYGKKNSFSENFRPFLMTEESKADKENSDGMQQKIEILYQSINSGSNGRILLKNEELEVIELEDQYELFFPTMKNIQKVCLTKDADYVRFYCTPMQKEQAQENLFHAIRHCVLLFAQKNGYYAIHSASILYRERAWLFSGHSGMGKSTHTALWQEMVGTPYLNGDLNLVGKDADGTGYAVYGIPWCGTSGMCTTGKTRLGGIVLLGRDDVDHVENLSPFEQVLRVTQRMISPSWTEEMEEKNLVFAGQLADQIWISQLFCTPKASSVEVMRAWIDERMDEGGKADV